MLKHSLSDLNDYLFDQLDRLSNDDLTAEQVNAEIQRSEAISKLASTVIQSASAQLKAAELVAEYTENGADRIRGAATVLIGTSE